MFADDGMHNSKPQSAPFLFGGKVRIKDLFDNALRNSDPDVAYVDLYIVVLVGQRVNGIQPGIDILTADPDRAAVRHRMLGVYDDILNDPTHLTLINVDKPEAVRDAVRTSYRAAVKHEFSRIPDDFPDRGGLFNGLSSFGKGEKLPGEVFGPDRRFFRFTQQLAAPLRDVRIHQDKVDIAHDSRQNIIEIVRDAARQNADRFQFLDLQQFPFHPDFIRYVPENQDHADDSAFPVPDRRAAVRYLPFRAVFGDQDRVVR